MTAAPTSGVIALTIKTTMKLRIRPTNPSLRPEKTGTPNGLLAAQKAASFRNRVHDPGNLRPRKTTGRKSVSAFFGEGHLQIYPKSIFGSQVTSDGKMMHSVRHTSCVITKGITER